MKRILVGIVLVLALIVGLFSVYKGNNLVGELSQSVQNLLKLTRFVEDTVEPETQMSEEELLARLFPSSDTPLSITAEWIPYYHRHPDAEHIHNTAIALLREGIFEERYLTFFAVLFQRHKEQFDKFQSGIVSEKLQGDPLYGRLQDMVTGRRITEMTKTFDLPILWGIYAATGSRELIDNFLQYFGEVESVYTPEQRKQLLNTAVVMSHDFFPFYLEIQKLAERSPKLLHDKLLALAIKVHSSLYDPASQHYDHANNYTNTKEYSKALFTYRKGLGLVPDEPFHYIELGSLFKAQKQLDKAEACFERARLALPEDSEITVLDLLAEIAYERGDNQKAMELYLKGQRLAPNDPKWVERLAWLSETMGDIALASQYLQQLSQMDTNAVYKKAAQDFSKHHQLVMPESDVDVTDLFAQERFAELDVKLQRTLDRKEINDDGLLLIAKVLEELSLSSNETDDTFNRYIELCSKWLELTPDSHFANAEMGLLFYKFAYQARGTGYASTITPEARKLLHERLESAAVYLQKAYNLNPNDSFVPSKMISVAQLHPDYSKEDMWQWFNKAVEANPMDDTPYREVANYLLPKWGGSYKECFAFARKAAANAPENSMVPVVLAQVHLNYFMDEKDMDYFKNPEVWSEVKALYTELLRRFPRSIGRHNWFARTASLAEDYKTAKREFDIIGDQWQQHVWITEENFLYYKNLAEKNAN